MNLQIISGTNRPENLSAGISHQYLELITGAGIPAQVINLEHLPPSFPASDLYGKRSPEFQAIQQQIGESKYFLFVVPEYNGSIPGILKIFIDACDYPATFKNKEVWMVGVSAGDSGNPKGLDHLTDIMHYLGAKVHAPRALYPKIREKIGDQGWITSPHDLQQLKDHCHAIGQELMPE